MFFLSIHLDISSRVCANKSGYFWTSFETFPATKARYFYRDVKKFPALFVVIQPYSLRRRQNNQGNFIEKSAHFQQFLCQQIQIFFSRCLDMFSNQMVFESKPIQTRSSASSQHGSSSENWNWRNFESCSIEKYTVSLSYRVPTLTLGTELNLWTLFLPLSLPSNTPRENTRIISTAAILNEFLFFFCVLEAICCSFFLLSCCNCFKIDFRLCWTTMQRQEEDEEEEAGRQVD